MKKLRKIFFALLIPLYSALGFSHIGLAVHDSTFIVGDEAYIPVYADSSLTGKDIFSYNLQLSFNQNYIKIDSVLAGGTLTSAWGAVYYNTNIDGKINIASAGTAALTGEGILLYLRIKMIKQGGTYLSFTDTLNNYFNEGDPGVLLNRGYLRVNAKPRINISPNNALLTVGDTKKFNAYSGTSPYFWSVSNSTVASIDSNGLLTALHEGFTKVIAYDNNGINDTTDNVEVRPFRLSIRDTSFYKGLTVDIPVYTTDLTGYNYSSGDITIALNQNILTPESIITSGTLLQSFPVPSFAFISGKLKVAFAGSGTLSGAGVLFIIHFQIDSVNSGATYLNFESIVFNENKLGNGRKGRFSVLNPAALHVNPSTATLLSGDSLKFSTSGGVPPYSWSVSDPSLASIDSDGMLTAIKGGIVRVLVEDTFAGSGVSGEIKLFDTKVWLPDTAASAGASIDMPVYMGNINSGYSIVSLQTEITFDSAYVKFDQVVNSSGLASGWSFTHNNLGNKVIIAGAGSNGFNSGGAMFYIRFNVSSTAANGLNTYLNFAEFLFNEGSPNALTQKAKITISNSAPAAPSNLITAHADYHYIDLSWNDNSFNETAFVIERSAGSAGSWSVIDTLSGNSTSYSDTGLSDGTKYFYRVNCFNSYGVSAYTNELSVITHLPPPGNLYGFITPEKFISLTWEDSSQNETEFILERKNGSSGTYFALASLGANDTSYVDSVGLTPGQIYYYRVKAVNSLIASEYSGELSVSIDALLPPAPTNAATSAVNTSTIAITWIDNSDNEDGFRLERRADTTGAWAQFAIVDSNITAYSDTGLIDGTKYFYRVRAFNSGGNSAYTNIDSAVTELGAPPVLNAVNDAPGQITLAWDDASQSEEGFIIERKDGEPSTASFNVIDTIGANELTYIDSSLTSETTFTYRVKAFNLLIESVYSPERQVTIVLVEDENTIPKEYSLSQNYPNPFNPSTKIRFSIPASLDGESRFVTIKIYDLLGRELVTLVNENKKPGNYEVAFNAQNLPSGIYLYRITALAGSSGRSDKLNPGEFIQVKKMTLIK